MWISISATAQRTLLRIVNLPAGTALRASLDTLTTQGEYIGSSSTKYEGEFGGKKHGVIFDVCPFVRANT